jgi:glutamate formiminotransferase
MRLLTVPNWSFAGSQDLERQFWEVLAAHQVQVHYFQGDLDHNRSVTAFSGEPDEVSETLISLAEIAFSQINLTQHRGVHPRIGALDVCPFIPLDSAWTTERQEEFVLEFAARLSSQFDLPVFLYEHSERGRHEADLPSLRRGQFEGMEDKELHPDFGPSFRHPSLGATVMGFRDFLIALNVFIPYGSRPIAKEIRQLRTAGDERFLGVRALGLTLRQRGCEQVSMNLTLPDLTPIDPIVDWISKKAAMHQSKILGTELIGVIRRQDCPFATSLAIDPAQIVDLRR